MECGQGMQQGQRQAMRQRQIAEERSIAHSQYSMTNANPPPNIQHRQTQPQLRQQQQIHHSQQEINLPHVAQQFNPLQTSRQQAQSSQVQQGQAPQSTQQHKQPQVHSKAAQQQPQTAQQLLQKTHVTQGQPQMQQSYNAPQLQSHQAAAAQSMTNQTENLETQGVIEAEMLQLKLKKESDKLINWKVQQMFTISNLEQSLKESEEIRERQKKNIFDLQMQLEKDIQNRQHDAKIRESLIESLQNCYKAKDAVTLNQDSLKELIVELSENIQNIESLYTKKVEHLESAAVKEQELRKQELDQCRNVQTTLEKKVEDLESHLHKESTVREELKRNLTVSSKQIQDLVKAKEKFQLETQQKLNNAFSMIKAKDDIINGKEADITELKGELERMKSLENELFTLKLAHQKISFEKTGVGGDLATQRYYPSHLTPALEHHKLPFMPHQLRENHSHVNLCQTMASNKRKCIYLSFLEKLKLIEQLESSVSVANVCKEYGIAKQTVSRIRKNKDKFKTFSLQCDVEKTVSYRKRLKLPSDTNLEKAVHKWYVQHRSSGVVVRDQNTDNEEELQPLSKSKLSSAHEALDILIGVIDLTSDPELQPFYGHFRTAREIIVRKQHQKYSQKKIDSVFKPTSAEQNIVPVLSDKLDISTSTTLSLETKIKDMEYRLEESSSRNRSFETQLRDLQEAKDALTSRVGQYTATQQDLEQEISQLNHELENLQSNHTSETENLKSVIQSRWDEIQKCDNLKMQSEMKEQKMSELTRMSEVQREEKTNIEKLLSAKSEEIMKLCKDLEDAHTQQEEWKVKFEKLEIEMAEQNDKTSHEWEKKWKEAIKEKDQALIESQLMVDKIKKDVEVRLHSELDKLNKIKEDVLQSSTKEIGDIVNEKDTIIEELKEIIKKEKESKENEVMILKKELENVTSSRSEEINKLKSDMRVLQQEKSEYIQKAKKELEDSKAESSAKLKDIMRMMTIEDKELRSQLVLKDKEISSVQSNLASNEKEVRALTEKIAELGKNHKDLTLEKKHQEELNKKMKEELNHLTKKINRMEENALIGVAKPIASSTPIINHGSSPIESALKINKGKEIRSPVQFDDLSSRSILKSPLESLNIGNDHSKKKVVFDISENENSDASIDISTLRPRNRKRFNKTKFNEKDGSYPIKKNRDEDMANSSVFAKPITHSMNKMPHERVFKNVSKENEGNTPKNTHSKRKQSNKFFKNRTNKDDSSPTLDFDFLFN
uniref:HTH psq-type domain-containing protein n=1 Tax=Timema douglasi TaxID=61478 RepID=A0A7R8Z7U7_TIMDO|nr:unnamed protein product [Timema douglasi]